MSVPKFVYAFLAVIGMACVGALPAQGQTSPNARLVRAVEENDLKSAQAALERGAVPDATIDAKPVSCTAAYHGQAGMLKALLDHGARLETRTFDDRMTLLMFAALSGDADTVQLLLDRKVKVNLQNALGETALMLVREPVPSLSSELPRVVEPAKPSERIAILRMLLHTGADKEAHDINGRTALMRYAYYGIRSGVEALTEAKAKVNARDRDGNTALILAAGWQMIDKSLETDGYVSIVQTLLKQGADRQAKNRAGVTALMAAAKQGHDDIVALLRNSNTAGTSASR